MALSWQGEKLDRPERSAARCHQVAERRSPAHRSCSDCAATSRPSASPATSCRLVDGVALRIGAEVSGAEPALSPHPTRLDGGWDCTIHRRNEKSRSTLFRSDTYVERSREHRWAMTAGMFTKHAVQHLPHGVSLLTREIAHEHPGYRIAAQHPVPHLLP